MVINKKIFPGILIVFALVMVQGVAAGECYELNRHWGVGDPLGYDLAAAPGIAIDASGNTYISTLTIGQQGIPPGSIEKIGTDGVSSPWGPSYGLFEDTPGTEVLRVPLGIAVDSPGNVVYVTEMEAETLTGISNYYIHKFTTGGAHLARWGPFGTGTFPGIDNPFSLIGLQGPVALDPTGNIYVAVTGETSTGKVLGV